MESALKKVCTPCRKLGKKAHGADVCLTTGGECARKDQYPPAPDLSTLGLRAADALRLFNLSATQWHTGLNGPTGLNYQACEHLARLNGIDFEWVFPVLQAREATRLTYIAERQERDKHKK